MTMKIGEVSAEVGKRLDYIVPMLDTSAGRKADLTKIVRVVLDVLADNNFIDIEEVADA